MKTDTKHTPGPWHLGFEHPAIVESRRCGSDFLPIPGENWHWKIVRLTTPAGEFLVTGENDTATARQANARLIAAAPDLLAALANIVKLADTSDFYLPRNWLEDARAAIAKAEGNK